MRQNTFVRTKLSRSSIFCLEHTLLLLHPFISCRCLETSVLPDAMIVSPRIAIYGLVAYPLVLYYLCMYVMAKSRSLVYCYVVSTRYATYMLYHAYPWCIHDTPQVGMA